MASQVPVQDITARNTTALSVFSRKVWQLTRLRLTIISPDGDILADSNIPQSQLHTLKNQRTAPDIQKARQTGFSIKLKRLPDKTSRLTATRAIHSGDEIAGYIRVNASLEKTDLAFRRISSMIWSVLILAAICIFIIGVFVKRFVQKQLSRFDDITQQIISGSRSSTSNPYPQEEFPILGKPLNRLIEHYQEQLKQLGDQLTDYQQMLASIREGILVINQERIILYCNDTAAQYLAISRDEAIGKYDYQIIRNKHLTSLLNNFFHHPTVATDEVQLDENRYLEIFITPIESEPQASRGALLLCRDITQSKQIEKIRRDFVANVSHEFKTPLAAIRGYAESLLDWGLDEPNTSRKYVRKIIAQSQQLENLVTDLLQLARIERLQHIDLHPFSPLPIINEVVQNYQESATRSGITLHIEKEAPAANIMGNPEMFRSIMVNLIDNAVKYTPSGGRIIVGIKTIETHCEIFVKDTGIGIPRKQLKRIFERFYRVDKARSRDSGGTGLGLSIVKHLVELQNAKIDVTSTENEGSCFTVIFKKATVKD